VADRDLAEACRAVMRGERTGGGGGGGGIG